nr:hypothetical protein [Tanacetum cinerariifolium]
MQQYYPNLLALLANTYNPLSSYSNQRSLYNPSPYEYHPYQPITPSSQHQIITSPSQQSYEPLVVPQQPPTLSTQLDLGFFVPSFLLTDDPIASLNKVMIYLNTAMNSRFPPTHNQLRTRFNTRKGQATETRVINTVREVKANQPRVIKCYNCKEQQDFFPDRLEEIDSDCEGLQLHTTSNFKADHVYAFDSDCDDEATSSAIFMASLYPARSINGDALGLTYHLDILPELVSNNDSYDELTSDNNVISYADYMVTIKNDAAQYVPPFEQTNDMILSCTAKKRMKDLEWLEEIDSDCEGLQLHTTSNFKADHVYAFDSDCDDEATSSAIFMASLYPARSINGDALGLTYHLDILPELVSNNDSYDELTSDNNVISYADYMVTIKNDAAQYVPPFEQTNDMILSFIPKVVKKNDLSKTSTSHLHTNKIIEKCTKFLARGRVSYTDASGSKPMSNTRNDRISRPSSRSKKNKVKDQLRKFKSRSNKNNSVLDCNANVKNVVVSNNTANKLLSSLATLKTDPLSTPDTTRLHMNCSETVASTSAKPLINNDLDFLFQPMFEYFKPPSVVSTTIFATTLPLPDTAKASFSISFDQDAPSPSTSPNNETTTSLIQSTNAEESNVEDDAESSSRIVDTFLLQ